MNPLILLVFEFEVVSYKAIKKPEHVRLFYEKFGGDKQDRTADLLHAMQALSQLSYTPETKIYLRAKIY